MNALLTLLALILCFGVVWLVPNDGQTAVLTCAVLSLVVLVIITRLKEERKFLAHLFVVGLLIRMLIGTVIYLLHLQEFFGGDAYTYDGFGYALLKGWEGDDYYRNFVLQFFGTTGASGWGMLYMVAAVYWLIGRNMLAIQFINAVLGAATAPIIAAIAWHVFQNRRVGRLAAIFAAFFPSLVLWSSQGLKDGPVVFLLALSILATFKLSEKIRIKYLIVLICTLLALFSLRFYIFYMMVAAIGGAFVIGMRPVTATSFVRQLLIIAVMGMAMTYIGVTRYANTQFETFGNLETVQRGREDQSRTAKSGFAKDVDVSTTSGALSAIPTGLIYLTLAPFPWDVGGLRQLITLPEMIVWWITVPFVILGLWFTVVYRLRQASPILMFTTMLTLVYSLFQGNVGTAYRQRSQLLVFYFIFAAVGYILFMEKLEEMARLRRIETEELARQQAVARVAHMRGASSAWKDETSPAPQFDVKQQPASEK